MVTEFVQHVVLLLAIRILYQKCNSERLLREQLLFKVAMLEPIRAMRGVWGLRSSEQVELRVERPRKPVVSNLQELKAQIYSGVIVLILKCRKEIYFADCCGTRPSPVIV